MKNRYYAFAALLLVGATTLMGQKMEIEEPTGGNAYDGTFAKLHYWQYKIAGATDTVTMKSILMREFDLPEGTSLRVAAQKTSLTATHISFQQYYNGIEVLGGFAKVAISRNDVLFRCIETIFPTHSNLQHPGGNFSAANHLTGFDNLTVQVVKPVFLWNGDVLGAGWHAQFLHDEVGCKDAAWWADGTPYFVRDLNRYVAGPDSTVSAKVFYPDPITPINKAYGGVYIDMNDGNETVLDALRTTKQTTTEFDTGYFHLQSPYVRIVEHSQPVYEVVKSNVPMFDFTRSHHGFEQVNAYYHIMNYQNYLQSLGYTLVNYPILVDAQGFNGADNSAFTPGTNPPRLTFGEGGVDDAEDADVVVHEYGHAISHSAAPNTNFGNERLTLDEALGDYFAVSYTRDIYVFNNDWVFNWDGHNPFWPGRTVDNPSNLNYKTATFSNIYKNTTLWNAAMFDIWQQIGKASTDKLQIEALFGYAPNMSFQQAAYLVLDADTALFGGVNSLVIWQAFHQRGILDWTSVNENGNTSARPYALLNTTSTADQFELFWKSSVAAHATLVDVNGRTINKVEIYEGTNRLITEIPAPGVYILVIECGSETFVEKLLIAK